MALTASQANDKLRELQRAFDDQLRQQGNGNPGVAFAKDVKSSLLFQYDWAELLSATPIVVSLMGACYVASSSPIASETSLRDVQPSDGFKNIQAPSLRACLQQVPDAGKFTFIEADKKMDIISGTSATMLQWVSKSVQYLAMLPDRGAAEQLDDTLINLKEGSDRCLSYARDMERKFLTWLELACEVHQVVTAKDEKKTTVQKATDIQFGSLNIANELTEINLRGAEDAAKAMKQNMSSSLQIYKKAADALPSSMDVIGAQLVASLGQSTTTNISQQFLTMMSRFSAASQGQQTLGQPNFNLFDTNDPAYYAATQTSVVASLLVTLLGVDTGKGVDWDRLASSTEAGPPTRGVLELIDTTLSSVLDKTRWAQETASTDLKRAVQQLLEITKALKAAATERPAADSSTVIDWQKKATDSKATILSLAATSICMPGAAPGSAPPLGIRPKSPTQSDALTMNAALYNAQDKARLTEAAYISAQKNYQKSAENRSQVQQDLTRMMTEFPSRLGQNPSLADIKQVLRHLIGTIIQLKSQIANLVSFFSALSAMVQHVVQENVSDFMRDVGSVGKSSIGDISVLDFARTNLYTMILMIQAYFSLFKSIPDLYKEMSMQYVSPGMRMLDQMGRAGDDMRQATRFSGQLYEFAASAQRGMTEKVKQMEERTSSSLQDRVDLVARQIKLLPAQTPAMKNAIDNGVKNVTDTVEAGFKANLNGIVAVTSAISS